MVLKSRRRRKNSEEKRNRLRWWVGGRRREEKEKLNKKDERATVGLLQPSLSLSLSLSFSFSASSPLIPTAYCLFSLSLSRDPSLSLFHFICCERESTKEDREKASCLSSAATCASLLRSFACLLAHLPPWRLSRVEF